MTISPKLKMGKLGVTPTEDTYKNTGTRGKRTADE